MQSILKFSKLLKKPNFYFQDTFYAKDLKIYKKAVKTPVDMNFHDFKFGEVVSDHMCEILYNEEDGWSSPVIKPFFYLNLHPFNSTLHYAFQCFEGMKAYKNEEGEIFLFRPMENVNRFLNSCQRIALPTFDKKEFLEVIKEYMRLEKHWIPIAQGSSYYLRPLAISLTNKLGVIKPVKTGIYLMGGPVSSYFQRNEIFLGVDENYHRNTDKNCGGYKIGSNYGPTVQLTYEAEKEFGFSQLVWTYNEMLLESGASNIFFVIKENGQKILVTHPSDGMILPGVTRTSILLLAKDIDKNIQVQERPFKITELLERHKKGEIVEIFMSGTAAVITQVDKLQVRDQEIKLVKDDSRIFSTEMKKYLIGIQRGKIPHEFCIKIQLNFINYFIQFFRKFLIKLQHEISFKCQQ